MQNSHFFFYRNSYLFIHYFLLKIIHNDCILKLRKNGNGACSGRGNFVPTPLWPHIFHVHSHLMARLVFYYEKKFLKRKLESSLILFIYFLDKTK